MPLPRHLLLVLSLAVCLGVPAAYGQPTPAVPQTIGQRVAAIDADIARMLAEIESKSARKARVDAEIAGLGERRAAARRRLKVRARALYRLTHAGILPVSGGFEAMLGHAARVERLERMVRSDIGGLASLSQRGEALRRETAQLAQAVEEGRRFLRELQTRKAALQQEQTNAQQMQATLSRPTPAMGAAQPSYGSIRVVDEAAPSFTSQRGNLVLPLTVRTTYRDARRDDGPGLEFLAPAGSLVRAAAEGRVAFSARYGSYGRLVILDHGDSYFTVYGGLGTALVAVGDHVGRGARIGDVGSDPSPAALFFEVRRGTRSLDARSWLGL